MSLLENKAGINALFARVWVDRYHSKPNTLAARLKVEPALVLAYETVERRSSLPLRTDCVSCRFLDVCVPYRFPSALGQYSQYLPIVALKFLQNSSLQRIHNSSRQQAAEIGL